MESSLCALLGACAAPLKLLLRSPAVDSSEGRPQWWWESRTTHSHKIQLGQSLGESTYLRRVQLLQQETWDSRSS